MKVPFHLLTVFGLFGVGGALLTAGILNQMTSFMYSSYAFSSAGIGLSVYLCFKDCRRQPQFEPPTFQPRLYRDPGMKKNKSDTNLELMGAAKNTTDDGTDVPNV
jgi:hypothetical protein